MKGLVLPRRFLRFACVGAVLAGALALPCRADGMGSQFVSAEGLHFIFRDAPFYYAGTNCYYLSYFSADPARRQSIDELLDLCRDRGFNVIRAWAFNDGGWNRDGYSNEWAYQETPTSPYNESALQGLDYALDQARRRGLKLILTLTNNWLDYGGMDWYVDASPTAFLHDDFYTDFQCKEWFKARIQYLLTRRNTVNDILYKDDPTIFSWELANEPRCWSDPQSLLEVFRTWAGEMSAFIKSLDPNHMISTGAEGFYNGQYAGNWMYSGSTGADFVLDHGLANIDFCTVHLYPDQWTITDEAATLFLQRHLDDAANKIGKPIILEEFGKNIPGHDATLQAWTDAIYNSAAAGGAAAGWHVWMIEAEGSGHDDSFSLFVDDDDDRVTIDLLTAQADKLNRLTAPAADVIVDGTVNIIDMVAVRNDLNAVPGSSGYIRADVNRDGLINIIDLIWVRNALNSTWP